MNFLESAEKKKMERIKELLEIPPKDRTDKMLGELMIFTKDLKLFENIYLTEEHQKICRTMILVHFNPNEVIVRQGDPGDSFFYILSGIVKIVVTKNYDILDSEQSKITVEKTIGDLKPGQGFGELSLIYGTPRSATIISVTHSTLLRLDKASFDTYVKDVYENQLKDQIDFIKICPVFHNVSKDVLIKLAIRSEKKRFSYNQIIVDINIKPEFIYIIRTGTVKVIKPVKIIKDESLLRKKLNEYKRLNCYSYDDIKYLKELNEEIILEKLSLGPTEEDIERKNYIVKDIVLENLKMGDLFPTFHSLNGKVLDVYYQCESPCELICFKIGDLQDNVQESYDFMKRYTKQYPEDQFIRKFYYYNNLWLNYKNSIRHNIIADLKNKSSLDKNKMRQKLISKKDVEAIKLPEMFFTKKLRMNEKTQ